MDGESEGEGRPYFQELGASASIGRDGRNGQG